MYDTLIIGGGISGIYCALHLKNVLLLEENDYWEAESKPIRNHNMKLEPDDLVRSINFFGNSSKSIN